METNKVLLGCVGVDSGQLMITDPSYISGQWKEEGPMTCMHVWGEASKYIFPILQNRYENLTMRDHVIQYLTNDEEEAQEFYHTAMIEAKKMNKKLVGRPITSNTYDEICEITASDNLGGPLPFKMGHEGFLVAFSSGYGDGLYPVYAHYNEDGRIAKVEIVMIDEEDED